MSLSTWVWYVTLRYRRHCVVFRPLTRVLVQDAKQMNLFDIAAVRDDFLGLFSKYLHANLLSCGGNIRLCLY